MSRSVVSFRGQKADVSLDETAEHGVYVVSPAGKLWRLDQMTDPQWREWLDLHIDLLEWEIQRDDTVAPPIADEFSGEPEPRSDLLVLGVLDDFEKGSQMERTLQEVVKEFGPDVLCVDIPPPKAMSGVYQLYNPGLHAAGKFDRLTGQGDRHRAALRAIGKGDHYEALRQFRLARIYAEDHPALLADEERCRTVWCSIPITRVALPLQLLNGFTVEPVSGFYASQARKHGEALAVATAKRSYKALKHAESAIEKVAAAVLEEHVYDIGTLNRQPVTVAAELRYRILRELWGSDAMLGCWGQRNNGALRHLRKAIERHRGKRICVLYNWKDAWWLERRLQSDPGVSLTSVWAVLDLGHFRSKRDDEL